MDTGSAESATLVAAVEAVTGTGNTMMSPSHNLTRTSPSIDCSFIIEVSSEEDGAEEDLVLIPPCSGATAAGYGSISEQAITTSASAGDSSNYSLNTMD